LRTTNANSEKSAVDLEEQTRRCVYELYERRGREAGHETEDWLQAEAELASERASERERERENHAAPAETVRSNRKPLGTKSGKSNPKQVKKVEIVDAQ